MTTDIRCGQTWRDCATGEAYTLDAVAGDTCWLVGRHGREVELSAATLIRYYHRPTPDVETPTEHNRYKGSY